jgi:hypothetical protein
MEKKFNKVFRIVKCDGKLFENSTFYDDVLCEYQTSQDFSSSEGFGETKTIEGLKNIKGILHLKSKRRGQAGKSFKLDLSENGTLNIFLVKEIDNEGGYNFSYMVGD